MNRGEGEREVSYMAKGGCLMSFDVYTKIVLLGLLKGPFRRKPWWRKLTSTLLNR